MKFADADVGLEMFITVTDDAQVMVISEDPHECGWPERITYVSKDMEIVRSGCAGCDAEREVPLRDSAAVQIAETEEAEP